MWAQTPSTLQVCCSILQCVAVCFSVLQRGLKLCVRCRCVASVLQVRCKCVASVLQVCCNLLQCVAVWSQTQLAVQVYCGLLHCVVVRCSVS